MGHEHDLDELKAHSYYEGFDWEGMLAEIHEAPFVPTTDGDSWMNNFDDLSNQALQNPGQSMVETIVVGYQEKFEAYGFNQFEDEANAQGKSDEEEKKSDD